MQNKKDQIEQLYRKFGGTIYRRAFRKLGDHEVASDLTQEIFKNLLGVAERLEDSERTHRYLFRCTTNAINRYLGQQKRLNHFYDAAKQIAQIHEDNQNLHGIEQRLAQMDLELLHNELSKDDRELLFYRFYEEMSTKEIAEVFSITDRAIRKRLNKLEQRCIQLLQDVRCQLE